MKIKTIFFDLDNTIFDHSRAEREALHITFDHFLASVDGVAFEEFAKIFGANNHTVWGLLVEGKINGEELRHLRFSMTLEDLSLDTKPADSMNVFYMKQYRKQRFWIEGGEEILKKLKGRYMLGLITNGFFETQQNKIQGLSLHTYIDLTITSEEAGVMKPDRKIFEYALERSNTKPEEALYIGDYFDTDIVGGHNAGLKTIWYNPKQTPKPDNGIIPYAEIVHLSELLKFFDL